MHKCFQLYWWSFITYIYYPAWNCLIHYTLYSKILYLIWENGLRLLKKGDTNIKRGICITVLRNTKLALGIYHLFDALSQMSRFLNLIFPISNVILLHTINQQGAAVENWINDTFHALFKDLYPCIAVVVQDFDIPTQTL